jgi:predicted lipase
MGQKIKPEILKVYDFDSRVKESEERLVQTFENSLKNLCISSKESDINDEEIKKNSIVSEKISCENETILETVAKTLKSLEDKILGLYFKHKTTEFKKLDREIFKLMIKLDDIDAQNEPKTENERKKSITKIHELFQLMDKKVECKLEDCIICKTGIDLNDDNKKE